MLPLITQILTYVCVIIIYLFILNIMRLVYLDIKVMSRKNAGLSAADAYLRVNTPEDDVDFDFEPRYDLFNNNIIGRGKKATIQIDDAFMSGKNTRIYKKDRSFYIEDLGSTNGTLLNSEPVEREFIELFDGDLISIGQLNFVFIMLKNANEVVL